MLLKPPGNPGLQFIAIILYSREDRDILSRVPTRQFEGPPVPKSWSSFGFSGILCLLLSLFSMERQEPSFILGINCAPQFLNTNSSYVSLLEPHLFLVNNIVILNQEFLCDMHINWSHN